MKFVSKFTTSFGTVCLSYTLVNIGFAISISELDPSGVGIVLQAAQMLPLLKPHYFIGLSFPTMFVLKYIDPSTLMFGSFVMGLTLPAWLVYLK